MSMPPRTILMSSLDGLYSISPRIDGDVKKEKPDGAEDADDRPPGDRWQAG